MLVYLYIVIIIGLIFLISESNEVVFLIFYTNRSVEDGFFNLSQFDETADKVRIEFPKAGQIVLGKVECDREGRLILLNLYLLYFKNRCLTQAQGQIRNFYTSSSKS